MSSCFPLRIILALLFVHCLPIKSYAAALRQTGIKVYSRQVGMDMPSAWSFVTRSNPDGARPLMSFAADCHHFGPFDNFLSFL
ncbi:uncharacterized protein MYCFIDRAFT_176232 [Pseudocercospora fijiensis CIRAD86]|uniref:Uncharacterized protein n=1 Tax=Pseudocercospora fijiensis (strain CIRAD86) TaxID=383855 RepID=M3A8C5_PSEFD|nr:uncharacterized protein MYCFIDRAFT_176232 [Pseudocercospora fijiensis CIRAD86]EME80866.1 hypothetical protein MYCFIDRAFT_176232 [Pseudocercospora fijiensis CIRAD86]